MTDKKTALVVGATGVVGRNLLRHLVLLDDWGDVVDSTDMFIRQFDQLRAERVIPTTLRAGAR